ncbi:VanZ family protein [Brevundimonas sp.]|uniref:VanZ family protein n=1 Tax=Brevundimonas sp. TaxID=1871086 RepID=UPI003A8FA926
MKSFLRLFAAAVIAGLLSLMLGPVLAIERTAMVSDKLAHAVAFFLIAVCLEILIWRSTRLLPCLLALIIGGLVEVVQGAIGRDASWGDFLADFVGITVAFFVMGGLKPLIDGTGRSGPRAARSRS